MKKRKTKREEERVLSAAEQRRLAHFTEVCAEPESQGYQQSELTIGIVKANIIVLIATIPVFVIVFLLFFLCNRNRAVGGFAGSSSLLLLIALLILIVVHEGVHGITWGIFADNHLHDIEFGLMKEYLTPYCTCKVPLSRGAYIAGALMPPIVLGVIPAVIGIAAGSLFWLIVGLLMILSAGGDVLIVLQILRFRSDAGEVLYYDHPTKAGLVVFEH